MKKVYLLLRNNSQSGPFTIDELLQQQLKPTDLIWKEGISAWRHPFEMDEFTITISKNDLAIPSHEPKTPHYKRRPRVKTAVREKNPPIPRTDNLEQRAEEIRRRALNYRAPEPAQFPQFHEDVQEDTYPINYMPVDVPVVYRKEKKRSMDLTQPITFALIVIWLGAVWFKGNIPLFSKRAEPVNSVATQMMTQDMHAAAAPVTTGPVVSQPAVSQPVADTLQRKDSIQSIAHVVKPKAKPQVINTPESTAAKQNALPVNQPVTTKPEEKKPEEKKPDVDVTANNTTPIKVTADAQQQTKQVANDQHQTQVNEEKKGGFFKNLFRKKKKEETTADSVQHQ